MSQRPQCPECGSVSVFRDGHKSTCLNCKHAGDTERFLKDTASSSRDMQPDSTSVPMRNKRRQQRQRRVKPKRDE